MSRVGAEVLRLAAAPTFAVMALLTSLAEPSDGLCGTASPLLGGMAPMYLLMAAFHAAPWLTRLSGR